MLCECRFQLLQCSQCSFVCLQYTNSGFLSKLLLSALDLNFYSFILYLATPSQLKLSTALDKLSDHEYE